MQPWGTRENNPDCGSRREERGILETQATTCWKHLFLLNLFLQSLNIIHSPGCQQLGICAEDSPSLVLSSQGCSGISGLALRWFAWTVIPASADAFAWCFWDGNQELGLSSAQKPARITTKQLIIQERSGVKRWLGATELVATWLFCQGQSCAVRLQLESNKHPHYPWLHTGSMLIQGLVGAAPFPLFAGTNASKCILHLLESLLSGQVKALLGASLAVWNDAAVAKINKF